MSNPLTPFMKEIAQQVIAPKIVEVFNETHPETETELHRDFCYVLDCTVSLKTFRKWMNLAQICLISTPQLQSYQVEQSPEDPPSEKVIEAVTAYMKRHGEP